MPTLATMAESDAVKLRYCDKCKKSETKYEIFECNHQFCKKCTESIKSYPLHIKCIICRPTPVDELMNYYANCVNSKSSTAEGQGLIAAVVNCHASFTVFTRNQFGMARNFATPIVTIRNKQNKFLHVDIDDTAIGTYLINYTPKSPGDHLITITVHNDHIAGSPFTLKNVFLEMDQPEFSFGTRELTNDSATTRTQLGVCCSKSGKIITTDRLNNQLVIFDQRGKEIYRYGSLGYWSGQLDDPSSVTIDNRDRIIVIDRGNFRVQVLSLDDVINFGSRGRDNGQFMVPWGVATNSKCQILVTDDDEQNPRIQLFTPAGDFLKVFNLDTRNWTHPRGICVSRRDEVLVSVIGRNNCVIRCDSYLKKSRSLFGARVVADGKLSAPQGIVVDTQGRVIIADKMNRRVYIFDPVNGRFLYSFSVTGEPTGVCASPDGLIIVAVCDGLCESFYAYRYL
uniref:RING-type domain-containing protein n=1 Tax=Strigamia maritima TaxID=126957 RepID=T1JAF5_STRMM